MRRSIVAADRPDRLRSTTTRAVSNFVPDSRIRREQRPRPRRFTTISPTSKRSPRNSAGR
jgi:hypothetical protein